MQKDTIILQTIMSPDNTPVNKRVYGYLRLSFIVHVLVMYLIYYQLYFLSTCLLQLKYDNEIIIITWWFVVIPSLKVVCGTIRVWLLFKGVLLIKITTISMLFVFQQYCIRVLCNWECGINQGNTVYILCSELRSTELGRLK